MSKFGIYFHTLRHLRPTQILGIAIKRVIYVRRRVGRISAPETRGIIFAAAPIAPPVLSQDLVSGVEFLNRRVAFEKGRIDWRSASLPKLWRYNLHYFDYLFWPAATDDRKGALIDSWVASNPVGAEDAWEPYTVSLRLVNWIKYFSRDVVAAKVPAGWIRSLVLQAAWLERNLETHILANHYLKNAKALVFAGAFFGGEAAERWRSRGAAIFSEQVDEQFMASGAHYELSPMYHCICVEDLLDVLNLAQGNRALFSEGFIDQVRSVARRGLDFLAGILMPDGRIPLFNDSAFGIAPESATLFDYAARLFDYVVPVDPANSFPDAGYFVLGDAADRLVVDCGPVSPSYQPGHTHCDMLSYELALDGRRLVVDAGVHDYENSESRRYCRGTVAHNTVSVDGAEQSELWGVFRVARRARPVSAELRKRGDGGATFEGEIAGFPGVSGDIRHRRTIEHSAAGNWTVTDNILGEGRHRLDSRIHFHPECRLRRDGDAYVVEDESGLERARVELFGADAAEVLEGWHYPEFGKAQYNEILCLTWDGDLPATFGYRIRRAVGVIG